MNHDEIYQCIDSDASLFCKLSYFLGFFLMLNDSAISVTWSLFSFSLGRFLYDVALVVSVRYISFPLLFRSCLFNYGRWSLSDGRDDRSTML